MDFAALGMEMDAGDVLRAIQALQDLPPAAEAAESAVDDLSAASDDLAKSAKKTEKAVTSETDAVEKSTPAKKKKKKATDELVTAEVKLEASTKKSTTAMGGLLQSVLGINGPMQMLRTTLLGVGAAMTLGGAVGLADDYTQFNNKLEIANVTADQFAGTQDRLVGAANRGGVAINSMAAMYQRAEMSAKGLGANQDKLLKLTDAVGAALKVNGGTAESASGAVLQLGQALGSGTVRAEEFNSMIEGAPTLLQMAANGMSSTGGNVSKLRNIMLEGGLTSKQFFDAMLKGSQAMLDKADKMGMTTGQGFNAMKNGATVFIGTINQALGVTSAFAKIMAGVGEALMWLSSHFQQIGMYLAIFSPLLAVAFGPAILAAITSVGTLIGSFLAPAIGMATTAMKLFTAASLANPWLLGVTVIIAIVTALYQFREQLGLTGEAWKTFFGYISSAWEYVTGLFSALWPILQTITNYLWEAASALMTAFGETAFMYLTSFWETLKQVGKALWETFGPTIISLVQNLWAILQQVATIVVKLAQLWWEVQKAVWGAIGPVVLEYLNYFIVGVQELAKLLWEAFGPAIQAFLKAFFTGLKLILEAVVWGLEKIKDLLTYITGAKIGDGAGQAITTAADIAAGKIYSAHDKGSSAGAGKLHNGIVSGSQQGGAIMAAAIQQAAQAAAGGAGAGGGGGSGAKGGSGSNLPGGVNTQPGSTGSIGARGEYESLNGTQFNASDSDFHWGSQGQALFTGADQYAGNASNGDAALNAYANFDWDAFDQANGFGDYSRSPYGGGGGSSGGGGGMGSMGGGYSTPEATPSYGSSASPTSVRSGEMTYTPGSNSTEGGTLGDKSSTSASGGRRSTESIVINNNFSPQDMLTAVNTKKGADTIENLIRADPDRFAALLGRT